MSTAETPIAKMILLVSSDGKVFVVERSAAVESETIKLMIDDDRHDNIIPIPSVDSEILAMVIDYCKKHAAATAEEDTKAFDAEFVKVDQTTLLDLLLAANYLNIKSLLDLTCKAVANMMIGMTPEELRKFAGK